MKLRTLVVIAALLIACSLQAQSSYQHPPKEILDVLNAPALPFSYVSPAGNTLLLGTPLLSPPISDLAEPLLRLTGPRINPRTNRSHGAFCLFAHSRIN